MSRGSVKCLQCDTVLYTFEQLAILDRENKLIVCPEVAQKRSETTERRENVENGNGACPWSIYCRKCGERIGVCLSDAVTMTSYDEIRPKYVVVVLPDGTERHMDKWNDFLREAEVHGVQRIQQKEFLRRAGRSFWSREGKRMYPTVTVDVDRTSNETLRQLTATEMRNYQMEMLEFCLKQNSLLCLPTGSGKTLVAAGVVRAMLHLNPHKVAAFVVNTNHLVGQQSCMLETEIVSARIVTIFGQMDPDLRRTNLKVIGEFQYDILVCTCACINALLEISTVRVEDLCCLVLDEAHEAKGNSPYAELLGRVRGFTVDPSCGPLVLGMTASPLDSVEKSARDDSIFKHIADMGRSMQCCPCFPCKNDPYTNGISHTSDFAFDEEPGLEEFRFKQDLDDYLRQVAQTVQDRLKDAASLFGELEGLFNGDDREVDTNKLRGKLRKIEGQLDEARGKTQQSHRTEDTSHSRRTEDIYYGYAMRDHMNQVLAVHEINNVIGHEVAMQQLKKVFDNIEDPAPGQEQRKKEALYGFKADFRGRALYADLHRKVQSESKSGVYAHHLLSNKCKRMINMIQSHYQEHKKDTRILVFVDMRRTARKLCCCFSLLSDIQTALNPQVIVGRGICGDGLSLEEQQEILNDFRRGQTKLLVTTTILEEGLDVPSCNMVLRMKAPDNLRQFIQSRGRACRSADGKFYIICKNEEEKERQQFYLTCMEVQARAIKEMMKDEHQVDNQVHHARKVLDLEEDSGRRAARKEELEEQEKDLTDAELQQMLDIMKQIDSNPQQEELPFLDEDELEKVEMSLRFAVFVSDDESYRRAIEDIKEGVAAMYEEIHIEKWKDRQVKIDNSVGTHYFPEAVLTLKENSEKENAHRFEKKILSLFTSTVFHSEEFDLWTSVLNARTYFPRSTALRLSLHQTSVGSLKWQREFIHQMSLGKASSLRLERGSDKIVITVNDALHVEAAFSDLREFALVDFRESPKPEDSILVLYITFAQTPRLSMVQLQSVEQGRDNSHRVLEYGDPNSRLVFANCLTYKLEIPNPRSSAQHTLIDHRVREVLKLLESSGVTVYYTAVKTSCSRVPLPTDEEGLDLRKCPVHGHSAEVNYAMRCLMSTPGFVVERMSDQFYQILNMMDEQKAIRAIYKLTKATSKELFCDPVQVLEMELKSPSLVPEVSLQSSDHAYIKRIIITPTTLRFYEPDFVQTNRIVRQQKAEFFVRVAIRDENSDNLTSLHGQLNLVINRVHAILTHGIKVGRTRYVYLAASNSQIRVHSCYFIQDDGQKIADRIRNGIGDLSGITKVGSYASRMGLGFSTSTHTIRVDNYYTETDVETGSYCFSDGVGLISASLANEVKQKQKLDQSTAPSAFQIRIGGCKGVVSVWKDTFFDRRSYPSRLVVRESMWKYPSDDKGIEVLEYTRPLPLHLNQQVIMLLGNVGVGDDVFMDLLKNRIVEMGKMFVEEETAVKALQATTSKEVGHLQKARFQFTSDPFFRSIMMANYRLQMKDLRERSRVRLDDDKGRVLIGVMDEEGVLEYGQVFIQISKHIMQPGAEKRVITSPIVIMKNPCIHPGDVRTFQGRDVPQLRHLVDCVVFPKRGPRPHPNELSGSDLDGDQYHCIWDQRLFPKIPIKDPMDYTGAKPLEKSGPVTISDVIDYTCKYIQNDTLGMIDNTHKALADQKGLESDVCLKLAEIHAAAVDAPKTENWMEVPAEIKAELKKYPDFMMKVDKPSYPSMNVLGLMFRECSKYMIDTIAPAEVDQSTRPRPDPAFKVEGYNLYFDNGYELFKQYNQELLAIMKMYGIETEAEVWSGAIATVYPRLQSELDDVKRNVRMLLKAMVHKYKSQFFNDPHLEVENRREEEKRKASAWYYAAYSVYHGDRYAVGKEMRYFLSFPWILSDVLADIYCAAASRQGPRRSLYSEISDSVKEIFNGTIDQLYKSYAHHVALAQFLGETCNRFALCVLFGASHLLLFDEPRGEVCILILKKRCRHAQENTIVSKTEQLTRLDRVKSECLSLFSSSNLNEAQCHLRVRLNRRLPKKWARLSADPTEVLKWIVIKKYLFKHQWLFPVLRILCTWMNTTGLVGGRAFFLPDYLVPLMFIDHCLRTEKLRPIPPRQFLEAANSFYADPLRNDCFGTDEEWSRLYQNLKADPNDETSNQRWEGGESGRVGRLLCSFMKQGPSIMQTRLQPELSEVLEIERWSDAEMEERLTLLVAEMEKASHRLSLHVNASVLLSKVAVERLFFIKLEASRSLAGDEDGLTRMLHQKSGAWVDIQSRMSSTNPGKIVKGTGTEAELYLLDKCIERLNVAADSRQTSRRTLRVRGMKDVTGAHNLLVEGAFGDHTWIRLEPYLGHKYPQHDYKRLYVIRLHGRPAVQALDQANTDNFDQFRHHFKHQMAYFQRHHSTEVDGPCEIQVKFGRSYVVSPPQSFVEDASHLTTQELLKALERRKVRVLDPMFDLGRYQRLPRAGRPDSEGFISTSFVSSVFLDDEEKEFLRSRVVGHSTGAENQHRAEREEGIKVVAQTGTGVVTARYDSQLNFIGIETAPIRWIVSDVKRKCVFGEHRVEGCETDIRFMLKTQMTEVAKLEDHALAKDFIGAIDRREKELYVKNDNLDVDYMEQYTTFTYRKDGGYGIPYHLVIRQAEQYTRRIAHGRFSNIRKINEVRIVPSVEPFLDTSTIEDALEALWKEAFAIADQLKCMTQ